MDTVTLLATTLGIGFVAGFRLYSTILILGLGLRFGWLHAPAGFNQHAAILTNPLVLSVAGLAFIAEFVADKVPLVDTAWDTFHTFIRPIGAILVAASALVGVDPVVKVIVVILCGGIAFSSHASKSAARIAVNHSPEPFTNIGLSLLEDLFAPFAIWLSLAHPILTGVLLISFLALFVYIGRKIFRMLARQFARLRGLLQSA